MARLARLNERLVREGERQREITTAPGVGPAEGGEEAAAEPSEESSEESESSEALSATNDTGTVYHRCVTAV